MNAHGHKLSATRSYSRWDGRCSCGHWRTVGAPTKARATADFQEHLDAIRLRERVDFAAYCQCGCQRRDHVHSGQEHQHTPLASDAPRDCLGPCLGSPHRVTPATEGGGLSRWAKCGGFVARRAS